MTNHTTTWECVSNLLRDAFAVLPSGSTAEDEPMNAPTILTGTAREFHEFLEQNELELAWDALAEMGRRSLAGQDFWLKLVGAADGMNLDVKAAQAMSKSIGHHA